MKGGHVWDVFLAYPEPHRSEALALYQALLNEGLHVYFDQILRPGDDWHLLLPRHLRSSKVVVALISTKVDGAHFARSELITAINLVRSDGLRLIPVRLDAGAVLPYGMEQLQALDMFSPTAAPEVAVQIAAVVPFAAAVAGPEATQVFCPRTPVTPRYFMGRDEMLAKLGELTRSGGTTVVIQALRGLGGVGKTSLAAAAVEASKGHFDIVWWVRAGEPTQLVEDLAELAPHLDVSALDDPVATADAVCQSLQVTERSWLVVFDNARNERALEQWLPRRGNGVVLVTSRSSDFSDVDATVDVDTFPRDVAEAFLRNRVRPGNPAAAEEPLDDVIDRLDGLPLALEQAAVWVAQVPNRRFARFVELYDDASHDPFPDGTRPAGYEHTATTTWRVSIRAAAEQATLAEPIMAVLSFLSPDDIPCAWLRAMADDEYFLGSGPAFIDEALDALHLYSLIGLSNDDTISIHRVIQAVARRDAAPDAAGAAIRILHRQLPADTDTPTSWPALATVAPHALGLATVLRPTTRLDAEAICTILDVVVNYQRACGAVRNAVTTGSAALEFAKVHLAADHELTLRSRDTLAAANRDAGNLAVTVKLLEANVERRERVQGIDHPDTLASRQRLGNAYRDIGNIGMAVAFLEANVVDRERVLGPNHPATITSRHSLGSAYRSAGNLAMAVDLMDRALADSESVLGVDHLESLHMRNDLGGAIMNAAGPSRAIDLFEENLARAEATLGLDHPFTLTSRNNLARAYQQSGDLDRAIPLLETNRLEGERVLDPRHPQRLVTKDRLALAYQQAGDLDRAIPILEQNLAETRRLLGRDHPDSLHSCSNLALAYQQAGDLGRSVPLLEANLADRERILGEDHPHTLACRNHLALALQAVGDRALAIAMLEAVLDDRERVLGAEHPETRQNREDLARARAGEPPRQAHAQPTTYVEP